MRHWYERELGWPTTGGDPLELVTGVRFDALDVPVEAGLTALRRFARTGPVALHDGRMTFLIAAGGAEELPGLLDWLEWSGIGLDLRPLAAGGRMRAPLPPLPGAPSGPREAADDRTAPVWLRPPERGCEPEPPLPTMGIVSRTGTDGPVGLVALVSTLANACHRVRLTGNQPLAFSYASRISAGTRPRSLTG